MQTIWTILRRGLDALVAHPRVVAGVAWVIATLIHPHVGNLLFLVGAIQLDDVNTITTKDIMPGVADR